MKGPGVVKLTIMCDLDVHKITGSIHVIATRNLTLNWVMDDFCRQKRVKRMPTFVFRNDMGKDYNLTKSIEDCELSTGQVLICYDKLPPLNHPRKFKDPKGLISGSMSLGFLILAIVGIIVLLIFNERRKKFKRQYAVVVDAGSTSSEIFLYSWLSTLFHNTGRVKQEYNAKIGALHVYLNTTSKATIPLALKIERDLLQSGMIPQKQIPSSHLFLGGTGILRFLNYKKIPEVRTLFNALREDFSTSLGLRLADPEKQVRIMRYAEEWLYSWITVNFLTKRLGKFVGDRFIVNKSATVGILDLNEFTTRIAFHPSGCSLTVKFPLVTRLSLYGTDFQVFTNNFYCYGTHVANLLLMAQIIQDEGFRKTELDNPCFPNGYRLALLAKDFLKIPCAKGTHSSYGFVPSLPSHIRDFSTFIFRGSFDYDSCKKNVKKLLLNFFCLNAQCSSRIEYPPPHGTYQAFSGFYSVAKFFNVTQTKNKKNGSLNVFAENVKDICKKKWPVVLKRLEDLSLKSNICFDGVYVPSLLDQYGIKDYNWNNIQFLDKVMPRNQVTSSTVTWTLGFIIFQSGQVAMGKYRILGYIPFLGLLFSLLIVFVIAVRLGLMANEKRKAGRDARNKKQAL